MRGINLPHESGELWYNDFERQRVLRLTWPTLGLYERDRFDEYRQALYHDVPPGQQRHVSLGTVRSAVY